MNETNSVRLNKYISASGIVSRRKADELIIEGRVSVNSVTVSKLGVKIEPDKDKVKIDGELIVHRTKIGNSYIYILLNKPSGYITTTADEKKRPTVMDLVNINKRIYPVGRLDFDSEGLLLLTNDGDLTNKLTHPGFEVDKTYLVKINRPIDEKQLTRLREGVYIEPHDSTNKWGKNSQKKIKTSKARVDIVPDSERKQIKITIHEGKNRQVRKMFETMGLFVRKLKRIEYGNLNIKGLKTGEWRYLKPEEVQFLKK
jgi:23S rRNA pseudouridine2605 synthase